MRDVEWHNYLFGPEHDAVMVAYNKECTGLKGTSALVGCATTHYGRPWHSGLTLFDTSATSTTPSSMQARQPNRQLQSCSKLHVAASWHVHAGMRPKQLQPSCRHASTGARRKPCSGSSLMQRSMQQQPHMAPHASSTALSVTTMC